MKTANYHISNFGKFAPTEIADRMGFVDYHDSQKYEKMSDAQLSALRSHRMRLVRNAAITELANRAAAKWRDNQ